MISEHSSHLKLKLLALTDLAVTRAHGIFPKQNENSVLVQAKNKTPET